MNADDRTTPYRPGACLAAALILGWMAPATAQEQAGGASGTAEPPAPVQQAEAAMQTAASQGGEGTAAQEGVAAVNEDARLEALIERRLAWDRKLAPFELDVEVNDAIVNLTGTVATSPESYLARRIAQDVRGVDAVVNGIYVDPALEPFAGKRLAPPSDEELEERVRKALSGDRNVDVEQVEVSVNDAVVTLNGQVANIFQKQRAERVARSLLFTTLFRRKRSELGHLPAGKASHAPAPPVLAPVVR